MNALMPFDELNVLKARLSEYFDSEGRIKSKDRVPDIIEEMLEIFLLAYSRGVTTTNESLSSEIIPPLGKVMETVDKKIEGKTWRDRVWEWFDKGGTQDDIIRIAETEAHRDSNAGAYDAAVEAGATEKVWHCMMLPTSREDHVWLDGVSAPIDGEFYNDKGQSTRYPGEWGVPEQDINCLCWLTYQ